MGLYILLCICIQNLANKTNREVRTVQIHDLPLVVHQFNCEFLDTNRTIVFAVLVLQCASKFHIGLAKNHTRQFYWNQCKHVLQIGSRRITFGFGSPVLYDLVHRIQLFGCELSTQFIGGRNCSF